MNKSHTFSLLQSASLPAPSSEGADGLYKIASPVFGEAMVCGELFYLIAADGAYIKNAAAVLPENRLDHFFIIR